MEFIDKSVGASSAHPLIDGFLSRVNNGAWPTDLYDAMGSDVGYVTGTPQKTKAALLLQLLTESHGRCCYCMRTINEDETTLEHVIPNKTSDSKEFNRYLNYETSYCKDSVIFVGDFLAQDAKTWPPYPHTIAYENLIPSCNGKMAKENKSDDPHARDSRQSVCCNNYRGSKFVIPFVFIEQIKEQIEYKKNGIVVWNMANYVTDTAKKEECADSIINLGLNDSCLQAIRRLWFLLSRDGKDHECSLRDRERYVIFAAEDEQLSQGVRDCLWKFTEDNYWNLLKDYSYFNDQSLFC